MTKRPESTGGKSRLSIIGTLLAAIILIFALILSELTGIELDVLLGTPATPRPPATVVVTQPPTGTPAPVGDVTVIPVGQGYGAARGFWQVFFSAPTGSRDPATYVGGIDVPLAAAIDAAQRTLDIAAFEWNNPLLTEAVLNARRRGVRVRIVTDNTHGLQSDTGTLNQLIEAGIPVVDDARRALMHNKFMIIDSTTVWTGSMNFTINGAYRNNNNLLSLRSRRAVESYQGEFNEMFIDGQFGPRSPTGNSLSFNQDGIPVRTAFAAEDDVVRIILDVLNNAQGTIRFMAFSFTLDELGAAVEAAHRRGVDVAGIYERVGSETRFSTLTPLFCAGLAVRQDGNPFILHHKVFIVDDTVLTGSFNFSANATNSNDENMVIIRDAALAAQFYAEFERRWAEARIPTNLTCE